MAGVKIESPLTPVNWQSLTPVIPAQPAITQWDWQEISPTFLATYSQEIPVTTFGFEELIPEYAEYVTLFERFRSRFYQEITGQQRSLFESYLRSHFVTSFSFSEIITRTRSEFALEYQLSERVRSAFTLLDYSVVTTRFQSPYTLVFAARHSTPFAVEFTVNAQFRSLFELSNYTQVHSRTRSSLQIVLGSSHSSPFAVERVVAVQFRSLFNIVDYTEIHSRNRSPLQVFVGCRYTTPFAVERVVAVQFCSLFNIVDYTEIHSRNRSPLQIFVGCRDTTPFAVERVVAVQFCSLFNIVDYTEIHSRNRSPLQILLGSNHSSPFAVERVVAVQFRSLFNIVDYTEIHSRNRSPLQILLGSNHSSPFAVERVVAVQFCSTFNIVDYTEIHSRNRSPLQVFVGSRHASLFAIESVISSRSRSLFEVTNYIAVTLRMRSSFSFLVSRCYTAPFAIEGELRSRFRSLFGSLYPVTIRQLAPFSLLFYTPTTVRCRTIFTMDEPPILVIDNEIYLEYRGRRMDIYDLDVRQDWNTFCWNGTITLTSIADYRVLSVESVVRLYLQGQPYELIIEEKSYSRSEISQPSLNLRVSSVVSRLNSEKITKTWSASSVRAVCEELLGQPIDWQIIDWIVPNEVLTCSDAKKIEFVRTILATVKAILQTNPDGSLRAQYQYPVSIPNWNTTEPNQIYTDLRDNLSYSESYRQASIWDAVVISDEKGSKDRQYSFEFKETSQQGGILTVYGSPWIEPQEIQIIHTGLPSVQISIGQIVYRQHLEEIEFKAGRASVQHPIYSLSSMIWHHKPLSLKPFTLGNKELETYGLEDYSIAEVNYMSRAIEYVISGLKPYEPTMFLAIENDVII